MHIKKIHALAWHAFRETTDSGGHVPTAILKQNHQAPDCLDEYKDVLIPIRGSRQSLHSAQAGLELAKRLRCRAVILYVIPPFHAETGIGESIELARDSYQSWALLRARRYSEQIRSIARQTRCLMKFSCVFSDNPFHVTMSVATQHRHSLVVLRHSEWKGITGGHLRSARERLLRRRGVTLLVCR